MIFRIKCRREGGHIRCDFFAARGPKRTFALLGTLKVTDEEYENLRRAFRGEFINEDVAP